MERGRYTPIPAAAVGDRPALKRVAGEDVTVGVRPEDLHHESEVADANGHAALQGTVELVEALGSDLMVHLTLAGARNVTTDDVDAGEEELTSEAGARILARFTPAVKVTSGDAVRLLMDPAKIHVFDGEGLAVR